MNYIKKYFIFAEAIIPVIFLCLYVFSVWNKPKFKNIMPFMGKVFITAPDNVKIAADYFSINGSKYQNPAGWVVFTHMMPATKESWDKLAIELQNAGYEGIAIDLRGHGESDGGPAGYRNFSDEDYRKSILDIQAAIDFIKAKGAVPEKISLIGASIGANLSLQYAANHPEIKNIILFSPGLNYENIGTEPLIKKLNNNQKIFFIGSEDDDLNSGQIQTLSGLVSPNLKKEIKIYTAGGHGTNILINHPEIKELIINFIKN